MSSDSSYTESVCPVCLQKIPAEKIKKNGDTYLHKTCQQHGSFEAVIWRGEPGLNIWQVSKTANHPAQPFTTVEAGCPYDCGPCSDHLQQPCCVLLEVTQRCDLGCPVCFASAGGISPSDPTLQEISVWFQRLLETRITLNIQLSGGEPCMRDDLPEIIRIGRAAGFNYFQLNTNGLRLACDPVYLSALKAAGLSSVYLQFDGVSDTVYKTIRGRALIVQKEKAVQTCIDAGLGVVLVATIIPGVNVDEIGEIFRFALAHHPGVRGIHFQPVSYFGRFPHAPADEDRITLPEIIQCLETQSGGVLRKEYFKPAVAEHARCTFNGNFVVMPDGAVKTLTRIQTNGCGCTPVQSEQARTRGQSFVARAWSAAPSAEKSTISLGGFGEWDMFLERSRTHSLAISGMAFQDAWTLDLERLRECKIFIFSADKRLIPFCAYNLTNQAGESLYRGKCE